MASEPKEIKTFLAAAFPTEQLLLVAFRSAFPKESRFLPKSFLNAEQAQNTIAELIRELGLNPDLLSSAAEENISTKDQPSANDYKRIHSHEDFFLECAKQAQSCASLRFTVVGPTFLEPQWWFNRDNSTNSLALNFSEVVSHRLYARDPNFRCEVICRCNMERYSKNLREFISSKTEWRSAIKEMRGNARKLFGRSGEIGPRMRCFDPGFAHLPHIFDHCILIGTRTSPLAKVNGGWYTEGPDAVQVELKKWVELFHNYPQTQKDAVLKLYDFLDQLEQQNE